MINRRLINRMTLVMAVSWALVCGLSLWWNIHNQRTNTLVLVKNEAETHFNKDQAFRFWASKHGGVYVPQNERTPPNPHLEHIEERDISTPSGKALTLMNPAFMMRQVMAEYSELYGVRGRIVSLKPFYPANTPDVWEREALLSFENGVKEVFEISNIDGEPYLRFMRPMLTKKTCLKCHAIQGYQVGDVRGAVGVSVPMGQYLEREMEAVTTLSLTHLLILGLGSAGIYYGRYRMNRDSERITHAKENLTELEIANKDLEAFSFSVSHDLRAPLRAIDGFTSILQEDYADQLDEEGQRLFGVIKDNAKKMAELIDDILGFSRAGRHELQVVSVDMNALVREVWANLADARGEGDYRFSLAELPPARCDPHALRQVWQNLLGNAVKFSRESSPPVIEVSATREKGSIRYSVRDNGVGFNPDYVNKLFILFQRLHGVDEFEGTGVGLAIAKRFIQKHGGEIEATGEPNKGAVFSFILPETNSNTRDNGEKSS